MNVSQPRPRRLRDWWKLSPRGLVLRAALLSLVYLVVSLAGFRQYTSIFTGTVPSVELSRTTQAALGLLYALLYVGFVLLVPTLLVAAALMFAALLAIGGRAGRKPDVAP